jgi:undecaprenyl-diphosphatase
MSIPAILGASLFKFADFAKSGAEITGTMIASCIAGFIFALVFGIFAIILIRIIARKRSFYIFSIYCLAVGLIAIIFG